MKEKKSEIEMTVTPKPPSESLHNFTQGVINEGDNKPELENLSLDKEAEQMKTVANGSKEFVKDIMKKTKTSNKEIPFDKSIKALLSVPHKKKKNGKKTQPKKESNK